MPRQPLLIVVMLILTVASSAEAEGHAGGPPVAVALHHNDGTSLHWLPGAMPADGYNIYGISQGNRTLLLTIHDAWHAVVSNAYSSYEITALHGSEESAPTSAEPIKANCITIRPLPPPPNYAIGSCSMEIQHELNVLLPGLR